MRAMLTLAASFSALTFLAGCAGAPSVPVGDRSYSESNSRAYNLAMAGGLREARDTKLGEDDYSSMMSDLSSGAGTALSLSSSAGIGLSGGASLGLGLASALFSGPGMMQRDSAFAFVPSSEATSPENATEVIRGYFYDAVQNVADNSEFSMHYNEGEKNVRFSRQRNISAIYLVNEELGCPMPTEQHRGKDVCVFGLLTPHKARSLRATPLAANATSQYSYPYLAGNHIESLLVTVGLSDNAKEMLGSEQAEAKRLALLALFSSNMPSWFYIYMKGGEANPPLILERGTAELFVTRK
ncbi:hypothetical protein K1Y77_02000 [Halomonas qaidamensis]|uniref:Lipoprotein n=1 Tax=Halomonas qaidamensis TaxID=2866211 RepID=A0ABY6JQG9_9GAMM|nr:hypothetical protein [Halomonas qaidamensis]UYV19476.1 hypothetical protein K1Y77_02000 [Halomonas qaidamensis]